MKYSSKHGDTLDLICWNKFGRVFGVLEQILELNPHIESEAWFLTGKVKVGTVLILPEVAKDEPEEIVRLFS